MDILMTRDNALLPTFKSLPLSQHKASKSIRPKPTDLDWLVGPAELRLWCAPSAVLALLMGLNSHFIFISQLLQRPTLCQPDSKNRRAGETTQGNNHSGFKPVWWNLGGLFNFTKQLSEEPHWDCNFYVYLVLKLWGWIVFPSMTHSERF